MAIIDQEGLFKGKRLRKCSAPARWRWPYLFLLSNGYARIELDYECIADEFSSFRESAPTPDELRETFAEFRANHLLYVYKVNDQEWGQWDTRRSLLKEYKTAADKASPAPTEPEYRSWLIEQHGNDWIEFHWNKDLAPGTDSPKTLPNVDQTLPKVFEQIEEVPCGVGVGVGVGSGVGEGNGKESKPLAHSANELSGDVSPDVPLHGKNEPSEPLSKNAPSDKRASTAKRSMLALGIYARYPRKVAKDKALPAIDKAIAAVSKRGSAGAVGDEDAGAQWLGGRVDLYAKSAQARQPDKSKVPYPASWFNAGRYDDDEAEWNHAGLTKGGVRTYEMLDGNTAEDTGLTEVLSRPDPEWAAGSTRQ
jgi:hypothetical protein